MRNARTTSIPFERSAERGPDDGAALFYTMSGLFVGLFAFVIWYCPRHL